MMTIVPSRQAERTPRNAVTALSSIAILPDRLLWLGRFEEPCESGLVGIGNQEFCFPKSRWFTTAIVLWSVYRVRNIPDFLYRGPSVKVPNLITVIIRQ